MSNQNRHDEDSDRLNLDSPLGLADEPITRTPADHIEGGDANRRKRARALGEDGIESTAGVDDLSDGATGIDMGYGGQGTNVKSS